MVEKPTVAIYTISLGVSTPDLFEQYVNVWWQRIAEMDPLPDQVVVSYYEPDTAGVTRIDEQSLPYTVTGLPFPPGTRIADLLNAAIDAAETDWVLFCGLDDEMLPDALIEIPEAEADGAEVLASGVRFSSGGTWMGRWEPHWLRNAPTLPAHSPIRKSAWSRVGGFDEMHYHDWGLWLKFAKHDIRAFQGTKQTVIYHAGENHDTRSGVRFSNHEEAKREVLKYADSLKSP